MKLKITSFMRSRIN